MTRNPLSSVWVQLKHRLKKRTSTLPSPASPPSKIPMEKAKGLSLQSDSTRTSRPSLPHQSSLQNPMKKPKASLFNSVQLEHAGRKKNVPPPPPAVCTLPVPQHSLKKPMEKSKVKKRNGPWTLETQDPGSGAPRPTAPNHSLQNPIGKSKVEKRNENS
jgi:hypothetical protein